MQNYIQILKKKIDEIQCLDPKRGIMTYAEMMEKFCATCERARKENRTIFFIGNGGSAGIASHMSTDFMKNGGFRTQSFYDPSLLTCMANDYGYEEVFAHPFRTMAVENDVLIAISSSGNSLNIVNTVKAAKASMCKIITLTGFKENNLLRGMGDLDIYVPIEHYGIVESIHQMILQHAADQMQWERNEANIK